MMPLWRKCCSYIRNHNHLFILEKPSYQNTFVESESDSGESESVIHAWEVTTIFLSWRSHHLSTSSTKCVIPSTEYSIPILEWGNTFFLEEVINLILSIRFWIHYNDFWTLFTNYAIDWYPKGWKILFYDAPSPHLNVTLWHHATWSSPPSKDKTFYGFALKNQALVGMSPIVY